MNVQGNPEMTTNPAVSSDASVVLSVVIPLFNEEANVRTTVDRVAETLRQGFTAGRWEIVLVNDGSRDNTWQIARQLARLPGYEWLRVTGYASNRGRGYALRTGFAEARGRWIASIDADLSYAPEYIIRMVDRLGQGDDVDIVLASPYMPGGRVEGVNPIRWAISRLGNVILSWFMSPGYRLHTLTCVVRAYRREVLESLVLESDGKELHLEILSKAIMLGYRVAEIPATACPRKRGASKFRFRRTAASHLLFAFFAKPIIVFGLVGFLFLVGSFLGMGYLFYIWWTPNAVLNPDRPLMTIIILAFLGGLQLISFGVIGTQIVELRKEIVKIQSALQSLRRRPHHPPEAGESQEGDTT